MKTGEEVSDIDSVDPAPTAPYEILLDLAPYEPSPSSIFLAAEQPSSVFV
jgi:hypothetical protein